MVANIATGEIEDTVADDGKDLAVKALGAKGGKARASAMTPERPRGEREEGSGEAAPCALSASVNSKSGSQFEF